MKKKIENGFSEENQRSDTNALQEGIDALKYDISQLESELELLNAKLALLKQSHRSWNGKNQNDSDN